MQQALALGVPTGLFCAVVLARQFKACKHELATSKQELEEMNTKHVQEIADLTARYEQEIADLTARHEQEITGNKRELANTEEDLSTAQVHVAWFQNRTEMQAQALNLFMEITRHPTDPAKGAGWAWTLGERTFILLDIWQRVHPHNMDISTEILAAKYNRELRDSTTVHKEVPQINGYVLMQTLHALNTCLSDESDRAAPEKVLPLVAALVAYTLKCFQHFFLLLPPDMTEKAVLDHLKPPEQQQNQMLYAWTNYFDPSS